MIHIYSKLSVTSIQKRGGGGPTFASSTEHTPAFNTVHIIAAVIGIIGAIAVFITIIYLVRKKRHGNSVQQVKSDIEANMIQSQRSHLSTATATNHTTATVATEDRFGRFASDFDNNVEPPKPAIVHVEDVSPMMQQYQLQLKLLQQQQQERKKNHLEVPTHNRASSSSSSNTTSSSLLPPPPYHP